MLKLLPEWLKIGVSVALGILVTVYPAILWGRHEGKQIAATEALTNSVKVLRERGQIDEEVSASDAADLCGSMGLSEQDRLECVRRVAEASAEPEHVGDDPQERPSVR